MKASANAASCITTKKFLANALVAAFAAAFLNVLVLLLRGQLSSSSSVLSLRIEDTRAREEICKGNLRI